MPIISWENLNIVQILIVRYLVMIRVIVKFPDQTPDVLVKQWVSELLRKIAQVFFKG